MALLASPLAWHRGQMREEVKREEIKRRLMEGGVWGAVAALNGRNNARADKQDVSLKETNAAAVCALVAQRGARSLEQQHLCSGKSVSLLIKQSIRGVSQCRRGQARHE